MKTNKTAHAIKHIKVENFLVFKEEFTADLCPGINIFIGENGTGKTTLLRCMYFISRSLKLNKNGSYKISPLISDELLGILPQGKKHFFCEIQADEAIYSLILTNDGEIILEIQPYLLNSTLEHLHNTSLKRLVYIPEKDILEHAKGLLTFIEQKQTGFSSVYKDVMVSAMDVPIREQSEMQKSIGEKIVKIIGGTVQWDKSEGAFYTLQVDGRKIPFANEASGFKKFGYLGLLVATGQLGPDTILLWDEPENSLNPELMPELVNILLELQRNGVQIFIATHNAMLANEFDVSRKNADQVMHHSLYKDADGNVKVTSDSRFDLLNPNKLTQASVEQYEREIERGLSGHD